MKKEKTIAKSIKETNMSFYTFVMDFRGGTYISQASGATISEATEKWILGLKQREIPFFGKKVKVELSQKVKKENYTPLEQTKNIWCVTVNIRMGFVLINIIKTCE